MKYFFVFALVFSANIFPQSERYTKGAENGYAWLAMDDPVLHYSVSKENYLSAILERYRLTQEKYPEIESLSCRNEIDKIYENGKSGQVSLKDVVMEIDEFYSDEKNMIVPIIFAYCYTIKKISGVSESELAEYKNQVLEFCEE
jgi:hypothetical protein